MTRTTAVGLLLRAACILPLVVFAHTSPLSTFYGEWWAAVLWLSAIVAIALTRGNPQAGIAPVLSFPLLLLVVTMLQLLAIPIAANDIRWTTPLILVLGAAAIFAGGRVRQSATDSGASAAHLLAVAFVAASLLGVVAQLVQLFRLEPYTFGLVSDYFPTEQRRLWGNLNQPNHQATVHGLGLAATLFLVAIRRIRLPVAAAVMLAMLLGIILSGSRTGMIHLGLTGVFGLLLAWLPARDVELCEPRASRATMTLFSLSLLPLYFILQPLVLDASDHFGWKLFNAVARLEQGDTGSARMALWRHAWAMFIAHPWFGVGWTEFGFEQWKQLRTVGMTVELAQQSHNQILDLLAKTGIIGTAIVALTLAAWLWRVLRHLLLTDDGRRRLRATLLGLTWLAMLCAHSMLEYPLHYLYFFLPFCFLLGWLDPGAWRMPAGISRVMQWRGWPVAWLLAGGVVLGSIWLDYQRAEAVTYAAAPTETMPSRPRLWFRDVAEQRYTTRMPLSHANAERALERHITALHVLPTPALIRRTALLTAMPGDTAGAMQLVDLLRFYYNVNMVSERQQVAKLCATLPETDRPRSFCAAMIVR